MRKFFLTGILSMTSLVIGVGAFGGMTALTTVPAKATVAACGGWWHMNPDGTKTTCTQWCNNTVTCVTCCAPA